MKSKTLVCLLALTLLITMLSGCGAQKSGKTGGGAAEKVKDSAVIAVQADITTLDPMKSATQVDFLIFVNIYDTLVDIDATGQFVPALADSWTVSDDGLTYTFNLHKGVKFHNGEEFTAKDVAFTINDGVKKSPSMAGMAEPIKGAVAVDDYTVKINLTHTWAPFLVCISSLSIENEKAVKEAGADYGQSPVGTGPYKFVKHLAGQKILLERNDEYFKGKAPIKNLEYKVIIDLNTTLIALQSGDIDFAFNIPAASVSSVKNNPKLAMHEVATTAVDVVFMNNSVKPFDNVLVRQAINYAIDKDSAIKIAQEGLGEKAQSLFSKTTFGYSQNVKGYEYNPEKAKALLAQAGYAKGFKAKFKTAEGNLQKAAEVIQENLSKIGIDISLEMPEKNSYIKDIMSGNYEMGNIEVALQPADADIWRYIVGSSMLNYPKQKNPKIDELFNQGRNLIDQGKRLAVYEQLAQFLNDQAIAAPLYFPITTFAGKRDLQVGYIRSDGVIKAWDLSWKK